MEFLSTINDCDHLSQKLNSINIKDRKNLIFSIIEQSPPIPYEYYAVCLNQLKEPSDTFNQWTVLSKILKSNNIEALTAFCNIYKPLNRDRINDLISKLKPTEICRSILLA